MKELDVRKFSINFDNKDDEFFGKITHPDLKLPIYLRRVRNDMEKYDIHHMAIVIGTKNSDKLYDLLRMIVPEDKVQEYEDKKDVFKGFLNELNCIEMDYKSADKLQKGDVATRAILFHEIGHLIFADKNYIEDASNRLKAIVEGRTIEMETDADEFALSVFGSNYYYAVQDDYVKARDAAKSENSIQLMIMAKEMLDRLNHIIELMKKKNID